MNIKIDARALTHLGRDLKAAARDIPKASEVGANVGAEIIATEARAKSSWSTRIPRSIRVNRAARGAAVRAGGPSAPHAGPYEHGGQPGSFRHPTFGHRDRMVSQAARPFLGPAERQKEEQAANTTLRAIDIAMRKHNV